MQELLLKKSYKVRFQPQAPLPSPFLLNKSDKLYDLIIQIIPFG